MVLLVVAAMDREVRALQRAVGPSSVEGLSWLITGVGKRRAVASLERCLATAHPQALVSVGLAGALSPEMAGGELVLCRRMTLWQPGRKRPEPIMCDPGMLNSAMATASRLAVPYRMAECVTTQRPAVDQDEREWVCRSTGASTVDMEGYYVARAAAERNIPFLAVRSVVDTYEQHIPPLISGLAAWPTWSQWLGAALSALVLPWYIPSLATLKRHTQMAEESLRLFGEAFVGGARWSAALEETA